MKKFVYKVLIFSFIGFFIYLLIIAFLGYFLSPNFGVKYIRGSSGHILTRLSEVKTVRNVDILFCGSSHSYRSFDTRIFQKEGISSFNLGSSAQTHIQTKVLLNRYLKTLNPKVVVYEVNPIMFSNDGVESGLDLISNDFLDKELISMAYELRSVMVYNTLVYAYMRSLCSNDAMLKEPEVIGNDRYVKNGFEEKKLKFFKHEKKSQKIELTFKDSQLEAFSSNVNMIRGRGIKLVFVFTPITHSVFATFTNALTFDNMMKKCGKYYNFNKDLIQLDDSLHFYDSGHLNQNGVELFNEKFIDQLYKDKIFVH